MKPDRFHPGPLVRRSRVARGWTQEDLADAMGSGQAQVSRVERGDLDPGPDWLARAAGALAVDPGKFGVLPPGDRPGKAVATRNMPSEHIPMPSEHIPDPPRRPAVLALTIDRTDGRDDPRRLRPSGPADAALLTELGHPHRLALDDLGTLPVLLSNRRVSLLVDYDVPAVASGLASSGG